MRIKTLNIGDNFRFDDMNFTLHSVVKDTQGGLWAVGIESEYGTPWVIDEEDIETQTEEIVIKLPEVVKKGKK